MAAHDHDHPDGSNLSEMELRVRALETILVEKGYVETAALDRIVELYETKIGPHIGAQVIAKAWSDPSFRQSLLEDATKAVSTLAQVGRVGEHLVAVENTPQCTIWWCARCARVIRRMCSACRRSGTSPSLTAREP